MSRAMQKRFETTSDPYHTGNMFVLEKSRAANPNVVETALCREVPAVRRAISLPTKTELIFPKQIRQDDKSPHYT